MTPLRSLLFSCCIRQRADEPDINHEHEPLIQPIDEPPVPPGRIAADQKLKERLGIVVSSQQGKMVNVNAQFPFNLHGGKVLGDPSSSHSTRSVSGGTQDSYSRRPSRSPGPSLQKSQSSLSLAHDVQEFYRGPANDSTDQIRPVLNARLIKGGRYGSTGSTRGRPTQTSGFLGATDHTRQEGGPGSGTEYERKQGNEDGLSGLASEERTLRASATHTQDWSTASTDGSSLAPPPAEGFTIHDAGAISRSWGD